MLTVLRSGLQDGSNNHEYTPDDDCPPATKTIGDKGHEGKRTDRAQGVESGEETQDCGSRMVEDWYKLSDPAGSAKARHVQASQVGTACKPFIIEPS